MKCTIFRCSREGVAPPKPKKGLLLPPPLELCGEHQLRYRKEYTQHFKPLVSRLAKRWLTSNGLAQSRAEAVVEELQGLDRLRNWQAHWLQMIDLELLNAGHGGQQGDLKVIDGQEVWVPKGEEPRPSAPSAVREYLKPTTLPPNATRAGQAQLRRIAAEDALLEQQLRAQTEEFVTGQRAVLTQELKLKREVALRTAVAAKKAKEKP